MNSGPPTAYTAQWWLPEYGKKEADGSNDRHRYVNRVVDRIREAQNSRQDEFIRNARLYGSSSLTGLTPTTYSQKNSIGLRANTNRPSFNVVKSCTDAYVAKLTKDKPKVSFVTSGGDKSLQDKAKGLERFVDGQMYELEFYDIAPLLVLDTCWAGNGIVKWYIVGEKGNKRIAMERVLPVELLVDDAEGVYGKPRNLYQIKNVDRVVLKAKYPQYSQEIQRAPRNADPNGYDSMADHVLVRESWHLPSSKKADDGLHTITIEGATLFEEKWKRDSFPFSFLRRTRPVIGWWGTALADDLAGIQRSISKILYNIDRHYHLLGAAKWIVPPGFNKNKLDNDIDIIESATPPVLVGNTNILAPEIYQQLDRLYQRAYELSGINQMTAQSQIPQQIESGKAIQALANVETDRFITNFRLYEHFVMDCVRQIITLARDISESDGSYAVRAFDTKSMAKVVFAEHWLEEEEYVLKMYPTNLLADDPSARMAQVQSMLNAGLMEPDQAMRLLEYPDTQAADANRDANRNATERIIDDIMDRSKYTGPDPIMDLKQSMPMVRAAYQKTIAVEGIDPDKVKMLQDWLTQADQLLQMATPPAPTAPPMAAPPGAPPMPPGPPPPPVQQAA